MKRNNRNYTNEFKQQCVQLANELDSVMEASRQLNVPSANIYAWQKEHSDLAPAKSNTNSAELLNENLKLRQEIAQLKKINHVLKSAAAFFSQDHL